MGSQPPCLTATCGAREIPLQSKRLLEEKHVERKQEKTNTARNTRAARLAPAAAGVHHSLRDDHSGHGFVGGCHALTKTNRNPHYLLESAIGNQKTLFKGNTHFEYIF